MGQLSGSSWKKGLILTVFLASLCLRGSASLAASQTQASRATMEEIFRALVGVFPLSLNERQFQEPANRRRILGALDTLAANAAKLSRHGQSLGPSYDFLRRSLIQDVKDVIRRYEGQDFEGARFALHQLTENCFACHTRLPSQHRFDLGKHFLEQTELNDLPLEDRVRLAVAIRQFDLALTTYEALFASLALPAGEIDLMGAFEDYLKIIIRVRHAPERAVTALETFRSRPDVPYYLSTLVQHWVDALHTLLPRQEPQHQESLDRLAKARQLIQAAQLRNRFPADRLGLVHFVVASSLLHRFVNQAASNANLSQAYYFLGITESYISHTVWLSETEFFLESAIRVDPASPYARKAYVFLEEYILTGYSGSAGIHVPADVQAHLVELRKLLPVIRKR